MKLATKILKVFTLCMAFLVVMVVAFFGYKDIPLEELKAKYAQGSSEFISIDGMDVHYRDEGDQQDSIPLILIHGTGSSLHTFDSWASNLKKEYRVVRMDLPGYGLTGPFPHRNYSIDEYVKFIKHFLDAKGIKRCIIGGNSLGGYISWRFALAEPDRVTKLILIDSAGYPYQSMSEPLAFRIAKTPILKNALTFITPKSIARSSIENVYADNTKVTDALVTRYFELTLRPGNRQAFIDRFEAEKNPDAYKEISSITQPTLILWGDQDLLIPLENAELFHQDLPNDTLVVLKKAGHVPMEEKPNKSLRPVLSFLNFHNADKEINMNEPYRK